MYQLLSEFAQDPVMKHNLSFGLTLKRCRLLKNCAEDVIQELQTKYPKNKNYKELSDIHIYVADTENKTSRDIREKLKAMYEHKKKYKRTIVFTSRLLYRAWSQTKIDSIMFCDNYKSTSFIVQSIGRGLRYNKENPNKICKILMLNCHLFILHPLLFILLALFLCFPCTFDKFDCFIFCFHSFLFLENLLWPYLKNQDSSNDQSHSHVLFEFFY